VQRVAKDCEPTFGITSGFAFGVASLYARLQNGASSKSLKDRALPSVQTKSDLVIQ
jgi:hypothetical protein